MDKYKKLISNTFIFAIGTFSSKVLVFLLMPFYTRVLTPTEYGGGDLIVQTANLLIPIVSIGVSNAIIRFGLDKSVRKSNVFTGGVMIVGAGYLLFLFGRPLLKLVPIISDHMWLIYLFVLTSTLRGLCAQFVRAQEHVRLYAFDGVLSTITVISFNLLFLWVFQMGVTGYVLATICSDLLSATFLFFAARLHRYIRFAQMDWALLGSMVRFALPLIPANIFWWITNVSDRYFITYMVGQDVNGLYGMAYKIPTMIVLVSGIFTDAWQMSAITETGAGRDRFFSNVASAYQAVIFSAAAGLLLFTRPLSFVLWSGSYREAWHFVPFLVLSTVFSCLVTFLGSIYLAEKKSGATLLTTVAGAVMNLILNFLLIPPLGANGAAFATFLSYLLVFVVRAVDTRKYVKIRWNLPKVVLNVLALLAQCWVLYKLPEGWLLPELFLCLFVLLLNFRLILVNLRKILKRRGAAR